MKNQNILSHLLLCGIFALSLSACRFGNHADSPTQINKSTILNSELFFANLTRFETKVYYNDHTVVSNSNSPLVAVPSDLLEVFTNPVYWLTVNDTNKTQYFWDNQGVSYPWQTLADASGHIDAVEDTPNSDGTRFYKNPNCLTLIETSQLGDFDRTAPGTALLPGATQRSTVNGKLKLEIDSIQVISGDCSDDLTELAACFQNGAGCDADQLARAKMFSLFVNGTGVLDIHRAADIIGLEYIVHFE